MKHSLICKRKMMLTLIVLLTACTSPEPSVINLPDRPLPQVPPELMKPAPEPSSFLQQLSTIFWH